MQTQTQQKEAATPCAREQFHGFLVVVASAAVMIALAIGATTLLSSPAGWVTKVANQAISDHQQAVATSFAMNLGD